MATSKKSGARSKPARKKPAARAAKSGAKKAAGKPKAKPTKATKAKATKVKAKAKAPVRAAAKPAARPAPRATAKPPARPPQASVKAGARPAPPAAKKGSPPAAKKGMPPAAKKGTPPAAKKGATGAPAGASKKSKRPAVAETVRPLGVLPPESIARPRERSSRATPPRPAPPPPVRPQASSQGDQPLTESDLKYFEERLLAERAKLMREMGHLENTVLKINQRDSSGDLSGYSFHMADAGTDAYEREKAFLFASSEGRTLLEINEALRRLYGGTYGVCESSGKPISRARLEAIPWARYTLEVQEQMEKEERSRRSTP